VPVQKANAKKKDWYSISVDTLRGWGLLLLILAALGVGYFGYRVWERQALEREALRTIDQAQSLLQQLQNEGRASSYQNDYATAGQSFQQAQNHLAQKSYRAAIRSAKLSYGVLMSILDAIAVPGSAAGQAQFVSIQGEVEYRRGDGGEWEEARNRVPLHPGDYVRTSDGGSAEIMFLDGTLYTVRPNTQFIVSPGKAEGGQPAEQSIQMEYGWVNLNTSQHGSQVKTPVAVAEVKQDSEAFVSFDKGANRGRFGAFRGGMELSSKGGLKREVKELQQVLQTGDLLSEPQPLPGQPEAVDPADNVELDLERAKTVVLAWNAVPGAARYALQVSRNHLFVDNLIDVENRVKTHATLGLRGEGTFQWRVAAYSKEGSLGPWSEPRKLRVASFRGGGGERDTTPPALDLDDVKPYGSIFIVGGRSEPGARVEINGELVKVNGDGSFTKAVQLTKEGWSFIEIKARDGWGNETVRRHRVFVENP
jgi:FecR-like protein